MSESYDSRFEDHLPKPPFPNVGPSVHPATCFNTDLGVYSAILQFTDSLGLARALVESLVITNSLVSSVTSYSPGESEGMASNRCFQWSQTTGELLVNSCKDTTGAGQMRCRTLSNV